MILSAGLKLVQFFSLEPLDRFGEIVIKFWLHCCPSPSLKSTSPLEILINTFEPWSASEAS